VDAAIPERYRQIEHALASIVGREITRKHLSRVTQVRDWNFTFPAKWAPFVPANLFTRLVYAGV
jgi:hypothetical protein